MELEKMLTFKGRNDDKKSARSLSGCWRARSVQSHISQGRGPGRISVASSVE